MSYKKIKEIALRSCVCHHSVLPTRGKNTRDSWPSAITQTPPPTRLTLHYTATYIATYTYTYTCTYTGTVRSLALFVYLLAILRAQLNIANEKCLYNDFRKCTAALVSSSFLTVARMYINAYIPNRWRLNLSGAVAAKGELIKSAARLITKPRRVYGASRTRTGEPGLPPRG